MTSMDRSYKQAKGMYPSLKPGERVLLDKRSAFPVNFLAMGLGWEPILKPEQLSFTQKHLQWVNNFGFIKDNEALAKHFRDDSNVDLDASCLIFDSKYQLLETVFFRNLVSDCGSVKHTGDSLTGEGSGDDETIVVELNKIAPKIHSLVFAVTSFSGQTFDLLANSYCRVVDLQSHKELARVRLSTKGKFTALTLARLARSDRGWEFQAINEPGNGNTYEDILPSIQAALRELDSNATSSPVTIWDTLSQNK